MVAGKQKRARCAHPGGPDQARRQGRAVRNWRLSEASGLWVQSLKVGSLVRPQGHGGDSGAAFPKIAAAW